MKQFRLKESEDGLIHICDKDGDIHKTFITPDKDGVKFCEALKKASVVYVSFDVNFCPYCGKQRDSGDC